MNPKFIFTLKDASTSIELKNAVDAIPRYKQYFTAEVRDAILQKQNLIIDAPTADAVVLFLKEVSTWVSDRNLLRTAELRDLIIDVLAPKISEGDPVENFGRTISNITFRSEPGAELYSNQKSFAAILDCFPRATTAGSVEWIVRPIYHICDDYRGTNKIFNVLPVVEAYSAIIPHVKSNESGPWIFLSIERILKDNEPAQKLFGNATFLEYFKTIEKHATSSWAKTSFNTVANTLQFIIEYPVAVQLLRRVSTPAELKRAVDDIPRQEKFYTAEVRDLLLQNQNLIDAPTADSVVSFLREFSDISAHLLRTVEIRNLIIDVLAPKIGEGDPVETLGRMMFGIVLNKASAELYSNRTSFSSILDCFQRATTAGSAYCIAISIYRICVFNSSANKILNDLPVVEAYSAIIPYATMDDCVRVISSSIRRIMENNERAQDLFSTLDFLEKFQSLEKNVTSADAMTSFKQVIDLLRPILEKYATSNIQQNNDANQIRNN